MAPALLFALPPAMHSRTLSKPAPTKMVHFIKEVLIDLPGRGQVVSVEVENAFYLVTLAHEDRGHSVHHLSAWDVSRSMRGDAAALAAIRAGLLTQAETTS